MISSSGGAFKKLLSALSTTIAGLTVGLIVVDANGQQPDAKMHEIIEPFKGEPNERIQLWGEDAAKFVRFEPEGLRVTMPAGFAGERPTGINTAVEVRGDFEITVKYEIFVEPPRKANDTASMKLKMMAVLDRKQFNPLVLARIQTGAGEPKFSTYATLTDKETGQKKTRGAKQFEANTKTGQLRMLRKDATVSVYVMEEPIDEFRKLKEFPFPIDDDIKYVRVTATTAGEKSSLDVRFSDLRIRWGKLEKDVAAPEAGAGENAGGMRGWLTAGLLLGVAIILLFGLAVGVLLFMWRRNLAART